MVCVRLFFVTTWLENWAAAAAPKFAVADEQGKSAVAAFGNRRLPGSALAKRSADDMMTTRQLHNNATMNSVDFSLQ